MRGLAPLLKAAAEIFPPPPLELPAPNILALVGELGVMGAGESRPDGVGTGIGIGGGGGGGGAVDM